MKNHKENTLTRTKPNLKTSGDKETALIYEEVVSCMCKVWPIDYVFWYWDWIYFIYLFKFNFLMVLDSFNILILKKLKKFNTFLNKKTLKINILM